MTIEGKQLGYLKNLSSVFLEFLCAFLSLFTAQDYPRLPGMTRHYCEAPGNTNAQTSSPKTSCIVETESDASDHNITPNKESQMTDLLMKEALIPLTEAIKLLPGGKTGVATAYRYTSDGARGLDGNKHVLESIMSAKKRWTSREAVRRFLIAINTPAGADPTPSPKTRGRQKASAGQELAEMLG